MCVKSRYILDMIKLAKCQLTLKKNASPTSMSARNVGFNLYFHDFLPNIRGSESKFWFFNAVL